MRKLLRGESLTFLSSFGRRHRRGSVFPATWRFSRVKPPRRDSPWRYVTNCLPNVLPRLVWICSGADKLSLSSTGSGGALPLDDRGWQLIMAREFCFSSPFAVLTGMDVSVRRGRQTMTNPERRISSDLSGLLCILFTTSLSSAFNKR